MRTNNIMTQTVTAHIAILNATSERMARLSALAAEHGFIVVETIPAEPTIRSARLVVRGVNDSLRDFCMLATLDLDEVVWVASMETAHA